MAAPESPTPEFADLRPLLQPRSIVVVGASPRPGNLGGVATRLLTTFGFPGPVATVHPGGAAVEGVACHARVGDLEEPAELALLAVPAAATPDIVRECAAAGTLHGIIWSGGFAESNHGVALQDELVEACRSTGFHLLGPNSLGIIDTRLPMTATFASFLWELDALIPGDISMVSQSGGLATMAQAMAQQAGFGFRYMISSGNEAMLTVADFLHELAGDPETRVIAAYLEGVGDGPRLLAALERARAVHKPVVILKAGSTPASARAAQAHTGALVGEQRVWQAIFEEFGVIQVRSLEELLDVALLLSSTPHGKLPQGPGLAAVTFGGGMGVLAADQAADVGLSTPPLAEQTRERLRPLVPPIASLANPVDLTPQTYLDQRWIEHLQAAFEGVAADGAVDAVLVQAGPMAVGGDAVARSITGFRDGTDTTVLVAWPLAPPGIPEWLLAHGIHVFEENERAIRALGKLVTFVERAGRAQPTFPAPLAFDWAAHVPSGATDQIISEHDCHRLLSAAGLDTAAGVLTDSAEAAAAVAESMGFPVVMKGISPQVVHRAAAGLLVLDVPGPVETAEAYRALVQRADALGVTLDGVYVQQSLRDGLEVLVSAFRDPLFGLMISCGAGGGLAESIGDVASQRGPVDADGAHRLLRGVRTLQAGGTTGDDTTRAHLADFVARFSQLAAGAPWEQFVFEVNPVKSTPTRTAAVDGLLIVGSPRVAL